MPKFSQISLRNLHECHPDLVMLFDVIIQHHDCSILEGYRGKLEQVEAFHLGKSKVNYPNSKHNHHPSLAADVAPYPIDWTNLSRFYWFAGYVMGVADQLYSQGKMKHKIRFGGDWDRDYDITDENGLRDLVHFEIIL